ncbi:MULTISPECIES: hypothetical protein [Streptomyces]|uniref:Secreted protein n=1 Tax=Streptomyces luteosporeus TaxID=173856 RepID=A0ABP6G2L1_9ACTN
MRTTLLTSISAAVVCGSLALGLTGPALAADGRPRPVLREEAPRPATPADATGNLDDTLRLGSRIVDECRTAHPDLALLRDLHRQLGTSAGRLLADVRARAARDAAGDPVSDVKAQVDTLVKDLTDLLAAVQAKDVAKVTALVPKVVADLQALLTSVPKLLTGAAPLPLPVPV